MTAVDIVIPTLNASALLHECLAHLSRSTFQDYAVIVYDDGSSEDIERVTLEAFPTATVIRSDDNRGLAYGCNQGLRAGNAPYVVLLNNDVEVAPEWLGALVACAERHPEAGSIASKLLLWSDRTRIHSAGDTFSFRGVAGNRGVWQVDTGQFDSESEVFAACGGAALYRRSALAAVAFSDGTVFDERLFMYYEDVDLAWRLQSAGFPCFFAPNAVVYHRLSATGGGPLASYYVARNALRVLHERFPPTLMRDSRLRIAATLLGRTLRTFPHLREPAARATLRGTLSGLWYMLRHARQTEVAPQQVERIRSLLIHPPAERFRGIPVARLRRNTTALIAQPSATAEEGCSNRVAHA